VQPWLGAAAVEGRLKDCRSPGILHLATHGFFLADQPRDPNQNLHDPGTLPASADGGAGRLFRARLENPLLRSRLALAGVNTWLRQGSPPAEAEDGLLTAEDVTGLDLLDTELVVLSACETGLGEVHVGEGVFGLRRAFVLAGAQTLVMSLWKVPDRQTQELMEQFYQRLLAGQPRAEALRQAQLAVKAHYPKVLSWGAFICQGDPGPLFPGAQARPATASR
jgi:CHAT domain-containing protein